MKNLQAIIDIYKALDKKGKLGKHGKERHNELVTMQRNKLKKSSDSYRLQRAKKVKYL